MVEQSPKTPILHLGGLQFIDSSGMGLLLIMKRTLFRAGIPILLVSPQPFVLEVLHLAHLDRTFPIFPTEQAALLNQSVQ